MPSSGTEVAARRGDGQQPRVVVVDLGVKWNTLRMLVSSGCSVTVVPATSSASAVLAMEPHGVLLSNGPGDPAILTEVVDQVRALLGRVPLFGICLGHQVLGLALGGSTYKLKFGHRGSNQPVIDSASGAVAISSHNHGFALDAASLPADVDVSHENLNDGCVEGLAAPSIGAFSVQYHPEAAPGPHDAAGLFCDFLRAMSGGSSPALTQRRR
jgi:carbamoyl-phosphate synthase small subunit